MSQRTSPMAQVRDAGSLLGRAELALPAVDVDDIVIEYPSPVALVRHLRSLGEVRLQRNPGCASCIVPPRDCTLPAPRPRR